MIEIKCYVVGVGIITDTQILLTAPAPLIFNAWSHNVLHVNSH